MISEIELAMIARLRAGLGKMVNAVGRYGGELDDVEAAVGTLPAAWVTFLGVLITAPVSTHKRRFRVTARFAVIVATYRVRQEAALRRGGPGLEETGCGLIIRSVRRLLVCQDLDLAIEALLPGQVRSQLNARVNGKTLAAYACEFDTVWVEEALDNGRWPAPEGDDDPDRPFADYQGRLDPPWPMHERTELGYYLKGQSTVAAQDSITTEVKDHD